MVAMLEMLGRRGRDVGVGGGGEERCEETSSWGNEGLVLPRERARGSRLGR